jgi:hypothetical protein
LQQAAAVAAAMVAAVAVTAAAAAATAAAAVAATAVATAATRATGRYALALLQTAGVALPTKRVQARVRAFLVLLLALAASARA